MPPNKLDPSRSLLCERCGYPLEDLAETLADASDETRASDRGAACPECGLAIGESLPDRRVGSAWQLKPGPRAWVNTNLSVLRAPRRSFRQLRVEPRSWRWLLATNLLVAGGLILAPWPGVIIWEPVRQMGAIEGPGEVAIAAIVIVGELLLVALLLGLLTWIECAGVRFFARRRGWRLTRDAAWQVCAHASVGWIVAGVAGLMALVASAILTPALADVEVPALGITRNNRSGFSPAIIVGSSLVLLAYFAGMMVFEWLAWVGVRTCRFANSVAPRAARAPEAATIGRWQGSDEPGTGATDA
ncbi:MAG: hypothetical protein SFZ23_05990 [Planctomycetota bacterium]|nr:hypothetical protein [Planctomycetota bacterium]